MAHDFFLNGTRKKLLDFDEILDSMGVLTPGLQGQGDLNMKQPIILFTLLLLAIYNISLHI